MLRRTRSDELWGGAGNAFVIPSSGPVRHESVRQQGVAVIGGIVTSRANRKELADQMVSDASDAREGRLARPRVVVASNGYVIASYHRNDRFRILINEADLVDADGMSLVLVSRMLLNTPLRERVATTDFIHDACAAAVEHGLRFYFLGAKPGVAERAAEVLRRDYPGLEIVGVRHGYFDDADIDTICADVLNTKADVLWLGLGSPRQEELAHAWREKLPGVAWIRTCGGLFDHYAGSVRRAPVWMQNIGLEWLFRAAQEPMRLGSRYLLTNPGALYHLATKTYD